jgi:hypothetical protein
VEVQGERARVRKSIGLRQISVYWEEVSQMQLLLHSMGEKVRVLRERIGRRDRRLLTVDGQILMEKNREGLDYFFSSQLQQLEVALTYEQLRQIMQVAQTLLAATHQKRRARVRELDHAQQLALHSHFRLLFHRLPTSDLSPQDSDLLDSLSQKLLLEWTREEAVAAIKRERVEQALQEKRTTWLGFLSRNAANLS